MSIPYTHSDLYLALVVSFSRQLSKLVRSYTRRFSGECIILMGSFFLNTEWLSKYS